jgi:hypothetical protein
MEEVVDEDGIAHENAGESQNKKKKGKRKR